MYLFKSILVIYYLVNLPPGSKQGEIPKVPKVTRPKLVMKKFPMALSFGAGTLEQVACDIQAMVDEELPLLLCHLLECLVGDDRRFKVGKTPADEFLLNLKSRKSELRFHKLLGWVKTSKYILLNVFQILEYPATANLGLFGSQQQPQQGQIW